MRALNLGKDKELKIVLRLALPAMLAQLINVLYSIIDRLYISNMSDVGDIALAGIGIVAPICTLLTSFSFLIGLGGAPLMSISLGEKNKEKAQKIMSNAFLALGILGIVIPLVILSLHPILIHTFGASDKTYPYAKDYLLIYLIGAPFAIVSLGLNQFIISLGYSTKGMVTMILGAIINIILDPIFIFACDMGVVGAALATVVGQIASFSFTLYVLLSKKSEVRLSIGGYSLSVLKKITLLGLSPFVIAATDSLVGIILNTSIKLHANTLVDEYIMVATITNSFFQIFTMPLLGISGGTGGILSFNYGAKSRKRVETGERYILLLALIFTSFAFVISFFIAEPFVGLFTKDNQVKDLSIQMIRIYMYGIILLSFQYCFVDGLTALGRAKEAVTLSLIRKTLTIVLTLVLPFAIGVIGCFYAELISDLIASSITLISFIIIFKKILNHRMQNIEFY